MALLIAASAGIRCEAQAQAADKDEPAAQEATTENESVVAGLSWDMVGGGIPSSGALIEGGIGFSGLLRGGYHYTLQPGLSVGGMASFDYAYWAPRAAFAPALLFQASGRYTLLNNDNLSIGVRADPGLGFFFAGGKRSGFALGILLNVGGTVGWYVQNRMVIGGGIDIPLVFGIPTSRGDAFLQAPILIGPVFEFHVTPPLALTFDVKMGPNLRTGVDSTFGLKMMAGVAYRL